MEIRYYALHDYDPCLKRQGSIEISLEMAKQYNEHGYGIYWTVNEYVGKRRIQNISRINYWYVDIDDGTKEQQMLRIQQLQFTPSMIIESKNGYHCYWQVEDKCAVEDFKCIERGLVQKLGGDIHCTDPVRLLRVPYFYHQKDPNDKFYVNVVQRSEKQYTTDKMLYVYGVMQQPHKHIARPTSTSDFLDESKWDRIFKISSIVKGNRNAMFARYIFWLKDIGLTDSAEYIINGLNQRISDPLPQYEIDTLLRTKGC